MEKADADTKVQAAADAKAKAVTTKATTSDADDLPSNEDALFSDLDFQVSDHCNLHQALLL